jgi:Autophagy protein Atg8 ubiquitin like
MFLKVIVDRYTKEKVLPALDKNRFLLPEDLTVAQFLSIIRYVQKFIVNFMFLGDVYFQGQQRLLYIYNTF